MNEDLDGDLKDVVLNVRFPGQYYDAELGLHYNYHRYYDPSTGRYITSDPIGLAGGNNTYTYALNTPLYWIDPFGLFGFNWHLFITINAGVEAGLSSDTSMGLAQMVVAVDGLEGSQAPENAEMYAMARPCDTRDEAQKRFTNYVNENLSSGTAEGLAKALHAIQEFHASGHTNFQTYNGLLSITLSHVIGDFYPSNDSVTAATITSTNAISRFMDNLNK